MSPFERRQLQKKRKSLFRKWHRRLGFFAGIILINLSVTGFLLNHYQGFAFHQKFITSDWLISWYGIKAPTQAFCLRPTLLNQTLARSSNFSETNTDNHSPHSKISACQIGNFIYWSNINNNKVTNLTLAADLEPATGDLIAFFHQNEIFSLVTSRSILLFTDNGELIDQTNVQEENGLELDKAFSTNDGQLLVESNERLFLFDTDTMTLSEDVSSAEAVESIQFMPTRSTLNAMQADYRQHQITQLKLLQDLHSGVFFFGNGKILSDLAAISIFLLAFSGIVAWQRRKGREQNS